MTRDEFEVRYAAYKNLSVSELREWMRQFGRRIATCDCGECEGWQMAFLGDREP